MSVRLERSALGVDADGFLSRDALADRASRLDREQFVATFPVPALLVVGLEALESETSASAVARGGADETLMGNTASRRAATRYDGRVAFLTKRPGNPFPHMISLGRAATNDLVLALATISKLHAYFVLEGSDWYLNDYRSTNGCTVNGHRLEKDEKRRLVCGDRLRIGCDFGAQFLAPPALWERTRGA